MTTATGEKLGQTGVQEDYGQALAEGEITRLLKTVQAAQFKKSEKLATTEKTEFKPRTLVEIAFASEQKQKQFAKFNLRKRFFKYWFTTSPKCKF